MSIPNWLDPLLSADESRSADWVAIDRLRISGETLMERAAEGLAKAVENHFPQGDICVLVGKGNNGGDGLAIARLLRAGGRDVSVVRICESDEWTGDAKTMFERLGGEPPVAFSDGALGSALVIIDCLLGTGVSGALKAPIDAAVEAVASARERGAKVVACDVPTGVNASTGEVTQGSVVADLTVTFNQDKLGLWISPGKAHAGIVEVVDIGIRDGTGESSSGLVSDRVCLELPHRGQATDKFSAGAVVVAGGSPGLTGAPMLAGLGAARGGAGYVTVALPASLLSASDSVPEIMGIALAESNQTHCTAGVADLIERTRRAGSTVIGPGLGRSPSAMAFARGAIEAVTTPLVIDADALHALAGDLGAPRKRKEPTVLTPHSGEMASILGVDRGEVQNHRLESVRLAAKQSGAVVVLKGDDTLIASANGEIAVSRGNSPALATAGSGDVLGGLVAALLAQGVPAFKAACAAVQIHAQAGRLAAGGATEGVLASDVANALPVARVELGRAA